MRRIVQAVLVALVLGAGSASAEVDRFNRPLTSSDDALSREVLGSKSPDQAPHFFSGSDKRTYSLDLVTGVSGDEGSSAVDGFVEAAIGLGDLPLSPSLDVTLNGSDLLSRGRVSTADLIATGRLFETAFGLQGGVAARATVGTREEYRLDASFKYRLPSPAVELGAKVGYRRSFGLHGYRTQLSAGYGVPLPGLQLVALRAILTSGSTTFGGTVRYTARAELSYRVKSLIFGLDVTKPVFTPLRPYSVGGSLGFAI